MKWATICTTTMSGAGQSRHLDRAPLTSGLPRVADIFSVCRHVSKVPARSAVATCSSFSGKLVARIDGLLYCALLRRAVRGAAPQRERSHVREVSGVPLQFVFQIEFGVRCPRVVRPGHDDIYHSCVEKRPNQCDGPHKPFHRCRQSTCA